MVSGRGGRKRIASRRIFLSWGKAHASPPRAPTSLPAAARSATASGRCRRLLTDALRPTTAKPASEADSNDSGSSGSTAPVDHLESLRASAAPAFVESWGCFGALGCRPRRVHLDRSHLGRDGLEALIACLRDRRRRHYFPPRPYARTGRDACGAPPPGATLVHANEVRRLVTRADRGRATRR